MFPNPGAFGLFWVVSAGAAMGALGLARRLRLAVWARESEEMEKQTMSVRMNAFFITYNVNRKVMTPS